MRKVVVMRTIAGLVGLVLLASAPRVDQVREIPGLSLRGVGCHVELLGADGGVICKAIVTPIRECVPMTKLEIGDAGMVAKRFGLGSSCPPPRLGSAALGEGIYFVETRGQTFEVVCDDASKCQRNGFSSHIRACCQLNRDIQNSPTCAVDDNNIEPCFQDAEGAQDWWRSGTL